ncbi:MAG: class B sortase [Oscillospiraceae bacterium]
MRIRKHKIRSGTQERIKRIVSVSSEKKVLIFAVSGALMLLAIAVLFGQLYTDDAKPKTLIASVVAPPPEEYVPPVDFKALSERNNEIVGWVSAPLLGIDEPVVQSKNNSKYLSTDFDGEYAKHGTVFLDCACDPSFESVHNVIYGHNLKAGGMFSPLTALKQPSEFERCRDDITLYTPDRKIPLTIIAVEAAPSDATRRTTEFISRAAFADFADDLIGRCTLRREGVKYDSLYSFITCSYEGDDYRTYIYAVERESKSALSVQTD